MRLFWRIVIGIGGLLVLLLAAIFIAVKTVDLKALIGPIQNRVRDATGRELKVNGNVGLKLSLEPKVVLEDVTLGNAPWGKAPQMLSAKRVEAQVALLPLLHRDFQVRRFTLVEPTIALETDANGNGNWEFGKPGATGAAAPGPSTAVGGLFIGDLEISNGTLTYRDGASGKLTNVAIDDFTLNARDPQSAVTARFRGSVDDLAIALEGDFGPLVALAQRRWPYPVSLKGEINGQPTTVVTQVKAQQQTVSLDPLEVGVGKGKLSGQLAIDKAQPRTRLTFKLAGSTVALADVAAPLAGKKPPPKAVPKSHFLFSEAPIDLGALHAVDADGDLAVDTLLLPDGRRLDKLHVQFTLRNGVLDAPVMQAVVFGGSVVTRGKLDAAQGKEAALVLHLDARGLELPAMLAVAGSKREIRGGKTNVSADISARGDSLHGFASTASGNVLMVMGPATLGHPAGGGDETFNRLAEAVNPFRQVDPTTEISCAVARLPLQGGVARIDRSIAVETNKIGANASGSLDFRNETLDLSIKPQIRKGISLNISQIASLVHFRGPFTAPTVGVDAMASAAAAATIGAALSTGGASLLGQMLITNVAADGAAPCQVALGRAGANAPATSGNAAPAQASPSNELNKALGKLLGR
jgi:uncharacterized protein involved in outer membrane biogenesis